MKCKFILFSVLFVICVLLCGCSKKREASPFDVYSDSEKDGLYHISSCIINSGCLKNDRVLLNVREKDGENRIILFDISEPEKTKSKISEQNTEYYLLFDDKVLEYRGKSGYIIMNNELETVFECKDNCGEYAGCTDDGLLWFFRDDKICGYSDGKEKIKVNTPDMDFAGYYMGNKNDCAYFAMKDNKSDTVIGCVDMQSGNFSVSSTLQNSVVICDMTLSYNAKDKLYFACGDDPCNTVSFPKTNDTEYIWKVMGNTAVTIFCDTSCNNLRLYDIDKGKLTEEISKDVLGFSSDIQPLDCADGKVLMGIVSQDGYCNELYLYQKDDTVCTSKSEKYATVNFLPDIDVKALSQEIEKKYGVTICYTKEELEKYDYDYKLECSENENDVVKCMKMLDICLDEYPTGFISELNGKLKKGLKIYLCKEFVNTAPDTAREPAASVNTTGEYLSLCIDIDYWWDMRQTLLHEMMHLCEQRIVEYEVENSISFERFWEDMLNNEKYPYFESYTVSQETQGYDTGTVQGGGSDVWFIDTYAKTNAHEDRARTLEYVLYDSYAHYYEYENIYRKAQFVCAVIRKVFPSVAACDGAVFWEMKTGVVDVEMFKVSECDDLLKKGAVIK